jgi:transposase-like protein
MKTNEEFIALAERVGVREAARQLGVSENTAKSWWRRREVATEAEPEEARGGPEQPQEVDAKLPWPYNQQKPPRWGPGADVYIGVTEEEREAVLRMSSKAKRKVPV